MSKIIEISVIINPGGRIKVFYYLATAVLLIGFASIGLVFALIKLGLQSFHVAVTTSIGSVAVSCLFPVIYNMASSYGTLSGIKLTLNSILSISATVSLVLIFIISIIASRIIPDKDRKSVV